MATLLWLTGFEHGNVTSGVGGTFDAVSGTLAISTTAPRTGARCLEISAAGVAESAAYNTANTIVTMAFYIYFPTSLPASNVQLARWTDANGDGQITFNTATSKMRVGFIGGTQVDIDPAVSTDTWYRVVAEVDVTGGTAVMRGRVNNGDEATATRVQVSANVTVVRLGTSNADTYTARYDDWLISVTDNDYEEMSSSWRSHEVQSLIPNADGTHNITTSGDFDSFTTTAFSNTTTTGYTFIDHRPLQLANTAENVIRQDLGTTAEYMELLLEDLTGLLTVEDVRTYGAHVESSTTASAVEEMRLLLSDDTEVLTTGSLSMINSTEDPGTTVNLRKRMAIPPTDGWDTAKVNNLKIRLGFGDNNPDANFIDAMLEVALSEVIAPLFPFKPVEKLAEPQINPRIIVISGPEVVVVTGDASGRLGLRSSADASIVTPPSAAPETLWVNTGRRW